MNFTRRQFLNASLATALLASANSCSGDEDRSAGKTVRVADTDVFVVERLPADTTGQSTTRPTVLFLHGASFNADVWVRTGILDQVAQSGSRAIAADLPGFGLTPSTATGNAEFLGLLVDAVDNGSGTAVVSPSMSGSFSLPMIATNRPGNLKGFVPVAPVGISSFADGLDQPIDDLPTLVIWGDNDQVINIALAQRLQESLPVSNLVVLPNAGHAAYEDQPKLFTETLVNFVHEL